jgi:hypothetical protein
LRPDIPCWWECPDPTNPEVQEYHTNFALDFESDQIYIYDNADNEFGLIHGVELGFTSEEILNRSLSLIPNGDIRGRFKVGEATPRLENVGTTGGFLRGDANADCGVDLSDGVFILNWLFMGGPAPGCQDSADGDDNGTIELTDGIYIFNWLFLGGPLPPDPGPYDVGPDPTEDDLPPCDYPEGC